MIDRRGQGFFQSITGKVLMAFLLGAIAFTLSWVVTRVGFREMLFAVNKLSSPNEKLRLVNEMFQELTFAQSQQLQSFQKSDKPSSAYLKKSKQLSGKLDSLGKRSLNNEWQLQRIDSMQQLLRSRDSIFRAYLALRADFVKNEVLSKRIHSVSRLISKSKPALDKSVVTSQKKITTTTTFPTDSIIVEASSNSKQSFFGKLFGGKKNEVMLPALKQVEQELQVHVDTLSVAKKYGELQKIEKVMRQIEKEQHKRTALLNSRELNLLQASSNVNHQLITLLHAIEAEELNQVKKNSGLATAVVNASVKRINYIMLGFFLVMAVLLFLILLDIARSQRYKQQLIAAKEEAEQLGLVKQRFLANMSHEIRTPLQSIIGYSEQLRQQETYSSKSIEAIYHSSEHLLQIVNEVLDYSRIISGKFVFERKPFKVLSLVQEVTESMRLAAEKKGIDLIVEFPDTMDILCMGDSFRLRQILYNLLSNAIKFTEEGTVQLKVKLEYLGEVVRTTFVVKDTGIGIAAEDQARMFQAFEQAEVSRENIQVGTGLGLSIVKGLIEAQGGEIYVSSMIQKGSEFTVHLNYDLVQGSAENAETISVKESASSRRAASGKVLVVDDDAFILQLCDKILQKHAIEHICTSEGEKVLEEEWNEDLKLVLLDIRMPVLNGFDLCHLLRERIGPNTKIYALTAQALPEEREKILNKGFDGILMKPFKEQELVSVVLEHLQTEEQTCLEVETVLVDNELNLQPLFKMVGEDEGLLRDILHQFVLDTRQDLTNLDTAILEKDAAEAEEILHKLASRAGQVGAESLSQKLRQKERVMAQNQVLEQDWEELLILQQEVRNLKNSIKNKSKQMQENNTSLA